MAYTAWSVVFGEQPSASKWNQLGTNDAGFKDGTNIDDDVILARHIADGAIDATAKLADDIVTDAKLDFPRFWQEIGRTTLSSAGDSISVASLPARRHLIVVIDAVPTGGTISLGVTFNGDGGSNYGIRVSVNNAADTTAGSQAAINLHAATAAYPQKSFLYISNILAQEKVVYFHTTGQNTAGAANIPVRAEGVGKWANTAAQISTVTVTNAGTGDYAIGSEVVALGHD